MFGIDGSELLVIVIVLIVVVGPKDLPRMMRAFGKAAARMRRTAQEFRDQFDAAMREADMHDVADTFNDVKKLDPRQNLKQIFDPIRSATQEIRNKIHDAATPHVAQPQQHEVSSLSNADDGIVPGAETGTSKVEEKAKEKNIARTGKEGVDA